MLKRLKCVNNNNDYYYNYVFYVMYNLNLIIINLQSDGYIVTITTHINKFRPVLITTTHYLGAQ